MHSVQELMSCVNTDVNSKNKEMQEIKNTATEMNAFNMCISRLHMAKKGISELG